MAEQLPGDPALIEETAREALRRALARLDEAEAGGRPFEMTQALAAVARSYRDLRAMASAEATFAMALRWAHACGGTDEAVDLRCEMAETAVRCLLELEPAPGEDRLASRAERRAARERARDHAFEAARLAPSVADPAWEVRVLLRISDVLEQCGDRDDAVLLQTRALRLMAGVPSGGSADTPPPSAPGRLADA